MRLHRLILHNIRGITHLDQELPAQGVIIIEGRNETGKTSMIDALDVLLNEKHTSTKAAVRGLKPVTADVGSIIEAEISSGDYRFRYRKQFNREVSALLEVFEPRHEQHTGIEAHERAEQILAETMDRQLWKALRMLPDTSLDQPDLGGIGTLSNALDRAAGTAGEHRGNEPLIEAVEAEYRRYYTPTGKPGSELRNITEALAQAKKDEQLRYTALEEISAEAERHEQLLQELGALERERQQTEERRRQVATNLEQLTLLSDKLNRIVAIRSALVETVGQQRQDLANRDNAVSAVADRAAEAAALRTRLESLEVEGASTAAYLEQVRQQAAEAAAEWQRSRQAVASARKLLERALSVQEAGRAQDVLAALAHIDARAETSLAELNRNLMTEQSLSDLEQAERERQRAEALVQATAGQLNLTLFQSPAEQLIELRVAGQPVPLDAEGINGLPLTDSLELSIPGVLAAEFCPAARAGAGRDQLQQAEQRLRGLLEAAGVADLAAARKQRQRRQNAEQEIRTIERERAAALGGEQEDELRARLLPLQDPRNGEDAGDLRAAVQHTQDQVRKLEHVEAEAQEQARVAEQVLARQQEQWQAVQLDLARLRSTLGGKEQELMLARSALKTARQQIPDSLLAQQLEKSIAALTEAEAAEATVHMELKAAEPEILGELGRTLDQALDRQRRETRRLHEEAALVLARLEFSGSQNLQEAYDAARTRTEELTESHRTVLRQAEAARALYEALLRHRMAARQQYLRPYQEQLQRLGRIVYGSGFSVEVDHELRIVSRTLNRVTLPYVALSTGAREQLGLLSRLACAALIDPKQSVPVLIDDALGYTDPERLRRINAVFRISADYSQLIVFTSSPQRYRGIGEVTVLTLAGDGPAK